MARNDTATANGYGPVIAKILELEPSESWQDATNGSRGNEEHLTGEDYISLIRDGILREKTKIVTT